MTDTYHAAKQVIARFKRSDIQDPDSQPLLVHLAEFFVANNDEDPESPATFEWLEARGWTLLGNRLDGHYAVYRCGIMGNYYRYLTIDKVGASLSLRLRIAGLPGSGAPPFMAFPLCSGFPTRGFVVSLERFVESIP